MKLFKKPLRDTALLRTITGKNGTGRFIHSVLDVSPLPNVHEIMKASAKGNPGQNIGELISDSFSRVDWTRTLMGLTLVGLHVSGILTIDQAAELFTKVIELVSQLKEFIPA